VILLDTNVLVYSITGAAPQHRDSLDVMQRAVAGSVAAVLVPQVILEAYSTVTSPRRVNRPLSSQQAWTWLKSVQTALVVKPLAANVLDEFDILIAAHPRVGGDAFDLFLVAQMRCLGVTDVCTYNVSDFALPGIRALEPSQV
jgi:predicted nucleic acid-binding protein